MSSLKNPVNGKTLPKWMIDALAEEGMQSLRTCKSNAGFYIGSMTQMGEPNFRASVEYFPTLQKAEVALKTGSWTVKQNP